MVFQLSGLAWHTEDATLRQKFEEFGPVEEAVCGPTFIIPSMSCLIRGRGLYFVDQRDQN